MPEVRVESERVLSEARRRLPTAFVADLATGRSGRALETLSDVLAEAAGVRVLQMGGLGAFSTVSVRGAPAGQVAVYMDGAPLTSAANGVVNLADLPAAAVERVEIYRSVAPLEFGLAMPGGAINLVSVSNAGLRQAALARGSFGTWEGHGTFGARLGGVSMLAHGGYQGSQGGYRYFDDNGTPFNPDDDGTSVRANNRFDAVSGLLSLACSPRPGLRLMVREELFRKGQGLPGRDAVPAYGTHLSLLRSLTHVEIEDSASHRRPGVRVQLSLDHQRERFRDPHARLGIGTHDTDDHVGDGQLATTVVSPELPLGITLETSASARAEQARLRDAADGAPDPPESRRRTVGASAGLRLRPLGDLITVSAERRWDRLTDALRSLAAGGGEVTSDVVREISSPHLGVRIAPGAGLELRANWTDASRAPGFLELFGNEGSVRGSPSLRPERSRVWDAGGSWSGVLRPGARGTVEWAHYQSQARDLIAYVPSSPSSVHAENISRARLRGEELSVRISSAAGFSLSSAFTWQTTIDQGIVPAWFGRRLPQRPERQAWVWADGTRGPLRAVVDVQFIGKDALNRANSEWAAARSLVGASLSYVVTPGARVTLEGKNLGDSRVTDFFGFPLPGRSVVLSVQAGSAAAPRETP
jgi:iron complex outermembrane receptor protein